MMNRTAQNSCGFADSMISYVYDEIGGAERSAFESHLPDCSACTDEFAAISNARLSVYEMRRDVFDAMPTPVFEIPYETAAATGFFAGVRSLLAGFATPMPIGAAIVLLIAVIVFVSTRSADGPVVADKYEPAPAAPAPAPAVNVPTAAPAPEIRDDKKAERAAVKDEEIEPPARTVSAKAVPTRTRAVRRPAAAQTAVRADDSQPAKAPRLSNYSENDDRSLRLTDLFADEIGSTR